MIYNIGLEANACFANKKCNSYLITGKKSIIIDTVPELFCDEYISALKAHTDISCIDSIFLLSATPERSGLLKKLLKINPKITVYSSVTGLRNLSEILNCEFNGIMCKNERDIKAGEYTFCTYITPNITHPDSLMVYLKEEDTMFTGELYSSLENIDDYYKTYLRSFSDYCVEAIKVVNTINPKTIYPAYGRAKIAGADSYKNIITYGEDELSVLVIYASETGNNRAIAEKTAEIIKNKGIRCELYSLNNANPKEIAGMTEKFSGIVLGTYTRNRNMPSCVWEYLSALAVNAVNGKPYFVFGSYGWSNEGVFIANEIASMLKMKKVCKPMECVFTPTDADFININSCADKLLSVILKQKEKSINA